MQIFKSLKDSEIFFQNKADLAMGIFYYKNPIIVYWK